MIRAPLVAALPAALDWRPFAWTALATVNTILLAVTLAAFVYAAVGVDWMVYRDAGRNLDGGLYTTNPPFRYSPLLAYAFALIGPLGYLSWAAAHFAALALLPRRMALIVLVSFPFWADVYHGNTMTFVFVAAYLALSGSRWGTWAFLTMAVLMPRPLMLPVLAWIVWQRSEWRVRFAVVVVAVVMGSMATGQGVEWLLSLARTGQEVGSIEDLGPAVLVGPWWLLAGIPLGAWLTFRGRLGLASLAVSPYWLSYYLLMLLLEARPSSASTPPRPP